MTRRNLPIAERLALKSKRAENGCLEWTGAPSNTGYGKLKINGKELLAHRVAYMLRFGAISEAQCVLHKCDNRLCIDTDHHFLGTRVDNNADMVSKGRQAKGTKNFHARLTEQDVLDIRSLSEVFSQKELAILFRVGQPLISRIVTRKRWRYLNDRVSI
jgi:hypothetical protein